MAGFRSADSAIRAGGNIVIPKPAGVLENDVLVACIYGSVTGVPSGWTLTRSVNRSSSQGPMEIYYKVATDSEGSSYTFATSGANGDPGVMVAYEGYELNLGTWQDVSGAELLTWTLVSNTTPDILVVHCVTSRWFNAGSLGPVTVTWDAGLSPRVTRIDANATGGRRIASIADEIIVSGDIPSRTVKTQTTTGDGEMGQAATRNAVATLPVVESGGPGWAWHGARPYWQVVD